MFAKNFRFLKILSAQIQTNVCLFLNCLNNILHIESTLFILLFVLLALLAVVKKVLPI